MSMTIGEKIRELRLEKGYTLDQLAEKAGSSKSYIWEIENKNPPRPSATKINAIAEALGVTGDYFLDEKKTSPDVEVLDEAFFRKYKKMPDETKNKIRKIIDIWDDED